MRMKLILLALASAAPAAFAYITVGGHNVRESVWREGLRSQHGALSRTRYNSNLISVAPKYYLATKEVVYVGRTNINPDVVDATGEEVSMIKESIDEINEELGRFRVERNGSKGTDHFKIFHFGWVHALGTQKQRIKIKLYKTRADFMEGPCRGPGSERFHACAKTEGRTTTWLKNPEMGMFTFGYLEREEDYSAAAWKALMKHELLHFIGFNHITRFSYSGLQTPEKVISVMSCGAAYYRGISTIHPAQAFQWREIFKIYNYPEFEEMSWGGARLIIKQPPSLPDKYFIDNEPDSCVMEKGDY